MLDVSMHIMKSCVHILDSYLDIEMRLRLWEDAVSQKYFCGNAFMAERWDFQKKSRDLFLISAHNP